MVLERLGGRITHLRSGRTYHNKHNPPKIPMRVEIINYINN